MTEDQIRRQLQINIGKIGLLGRQIQRAYGKEHSDLKADRLKRKQKKLIEANNKLLLQLEEKYEPWD